MKGLELNEKSTILILRWLTVLLAILLMLYSRKGLTFGTGAYLLGVAFFLSNIIFTFIPRKQFAKPAMSSIIVIMDAGFISLAIYLTSGFNTDFYLVYFFIILIAAMRQELKGSIVTGSIAITLYGLLIYRSSPNFAILNTPFLIRAIFLLLIATFSGYLAQRAKVHEDARRIAEKKLEETQEQLLRSERLAVIGQLAASVGHELRNPLGVLQNSLYLLNLKLKDADEKVKKQVATMKRELARSNKIITDLLEFSRERELSFAPANLNHIIEEVLAKVEIPEGVGIVKELKDIPIVMANGDQLQSVFVNLISNGVQAMPEGGTLTVKTDQEDSFVEVRVSDTGIGIPRENFEKIFEPLFTTKTKGIGLGLAITRRFIENHGGTISVESNPSFGTSFSIRLPMRERKRKKRSDHRYERTALPS